jgi:multidrug resistance protein MdtO
MLDSPPLQKWVKLALVEKRSVREHIEALRQAAASSFEILSLIGVMNRDVDAALPTPLRERLTLTLDAMARILDDGGYPADIEFEEASDGEQSLPPRAAEVLAGVREALSAFAKAIPDTHLRVRLLPTRSPIQSMPVTHSRRPPQPCSAMFSFRCLTGRAFRGRRRTLI